MAHDVPPGEAADLQRRHDHLLDAMRARDVEQLVLTTMESPYYLTAATAVPLERPFFLGVDARPRGDAPRPRRHAGG